MKEQDTDADTNSKRLFVSGKNNKIKGGSYSSVFGIDNEITDNTNSIVGGNNSNLNTIEGSTILGKNLNITNSFQ